MDARHNCHNYKPSRCLRLALKKLCLHFFSAISTKNSLFFTLLRGHNFGLARRWSSANQRMMSFQPMPIKTGQWFSNCHISFLTKFRVDQKCLRFFQPRFQGLPYRWGKGGREERPWKRGCNFSWMINRHMLLWRFKMAKNNRSPCWMLLWRADLELTDDLFSRVLAHGTFTQTELPTTQKRLLRRRIKKPRLWSVLYKAGRKRIEHRV